MKELREIHKQPLLPDEITEGTYSFKISGTQFLCDLIVECVEDDRIIYRISLNGSGMIKPADLATLLNCQSFALFNPS